MVFTQADTRWTDLLGSLAKLVDHKSYTQTELENFDWATKTRLINSDPVTCARYFDHRVQKFINSVLKGPCDPLGEITDFFYRVEFQHRGSPHIHMLLWIKDAPKHEIDKTEEIVAFIDKHVSCSLDVSQNEKEFVELQMHKHSKTCRKGGKAICRFGYPIPPMRITCILEPLGDDENAVKNYEKIKTKLESMGDGSNETFDDFLESLQITETDYVKWSVSN